MPRIQSTIFRTANDKLTKFIVDNFDLKTDGHLLTQKREPGVGTAIEVAENPQFTKHKQNEVYWKVGFLMPDVKQLVTSLRSRGVKVSDPDQFLDIGYLCHTSDADGNSYELLQHTFERNFKGPCAQNPVTVGQITIRTSKLDETLDFYCKKLGMKKLSVQPVTEYGFCLYFLGYTELDPPNVEDLEAVENREWLWEKPFCTIEIQHKKSGVESYEDLEQNESGWAGIRLTMTADEAQSLLGVKDSTRLRDPNNIPIHVEVAAGN